MVVTIASDVTYSIEIAFPSKNSQLDHMIYERTEQLCQKWSLAMSPKVRHLSCLNFYLCNGANNPSPYFAIINAAPSRHEFELYWGVQLMS